MGNRVYTYTAGEAIGPGVAVQLSAITDGEVLIATDGTVAGAQILAGVSQHGAALGDPIDVIVEGEAFVKAAAPFGGTPLMKLTVGAGGGFQPAVAGLDQVLAQAVGNIGTAAINSGEDVKVLVGPAYNA